VSQRWLVTGAGGMLGTALEAALHDREATFLTRAELDITDLAAVTAAVPDHDVVVNAAAYTGVDDAETHVAVATAVNATGAQNLAIATELSGARLVQISTDYVFDGTASEPYTEDTPVSPLSVYGTTKADGERLALGANPSGTIVLRTAWLYGAGAPNFVTTVIGLAERQQEVAVLTDQFGQPTWTRDLAARVVAAVDASVPAGIYHATNSGACSRFEFAREIFRLAGLDPDRIVPAQPGQFDRPAPRPAYSVLSDEAWARVGMPGLRPWDVALTEARRSGVF
jgi:dTDP-4-dehydrorhamnose reductase